MFPVGCSKRHLRRLIQKEKAIYVNRLLNATKSNEEIIVPCIPQHDDLDDETPNSIVKIEEEQVCEQNILCENLDDWYEDEYQENKRFKFDENLESNNNPSTSQVMQSCTTPCDIKFEHFNESVCELENKIDKLQATVVAQNTAIMEAIATQKVLIEKLLLVKDHEAIVRSTFPIQTVDDLAEVNNNIVEDNRTDYISCLSSLLKGKLHKTLTGIFSLDLIIASNIDGIHGKVAIKLYTHFFDALMDAIRKNGEEDPGKALRNGLKLIKKRHFQSVCVNKKKSTSLDNHNEGPSQ